jgi:hypothetical protein
VLRLLPKKTPKSANSPGPGLRTLDPPLAGLKEFKILLVAELNYLTTFIEKISTSYLFNGSDLLEDVGI